MKRLKYQWKKYREAGQSFVELAIGMTVLITLLSGLFDVGRAYLFLVAVENAAAEGALYGAIRPQCIAPDRAETVCQGIESITGRVIEEGKPIITISEEYITLSLEESGSVVAITSGDQIVAGQTLLVNVKYTYSPVTPFGFMIWGEKATVNASARQPILSPPRPGTMN